VVDVHAFGTSSSDDKVGMTVAVHVRCCSPRRVDWSSTNSCGELPGLARDLSADPDVATECAPKEYASWQV
jgi:hypothetical protein